MTLESIDSIFGNATFVSQLCTPPSTTSGWHEQAASELLINCKLDYILRAASTINIYIEKLLSVYFDALASVLL